MKKTEVQEGIQVFLQWFAANRRPATVAIYDRYLRAFAARVPGKTCDALTALDLLQFSNRHKPMECVKRWYRWLAAAQGSTAADPFAAIKPPRPGRRRRVLGRREMLLLLRAAAPAFRRFLLAMRETLARPQEIRALAWGMLRDAEGFAAERRSPADGDLTFWLDEFKSADRRGVDAELRVIPISPRLGRMLERLRRGDRSPGGKIFRGDHGAAWTNNAVRCCMRRLRAKMEPVLGTHREKIVAYTMRHSAATQAARAGLPVPVLSFAMGHTSARMTERYLHIAARDMVEGMAKLRRNAADRRGDPRRR